MKPLLCVVAAIVVFAWLVSALFDKRVEMLERRCGLSHEPRTAEYRACIDTNWMIK